jgi:predicted RNase H-like nuclease (RuvC/YqgF family)
VFKKNYKLPSLKETERYIKQNGHLPEIPAASAIEENGLSIGEMLTLQMKKIEELTLHIIEQQKQIEILKNEVNQLKK